MLDSFKPVADNACNGLIIFMILTAEQKNEIVQAVEKLERESAQSGLGFHRFSSTYRTLQAFHNKKLGVVVKKQNFILDDRTPMDVRVPTLDLKNGWVIQPFVKKVRLKEACDIIKEKLNRCYHEGVFPDLHTGNVGWLGNEPKMFDW